MITGTKRMSLTPESVLTKISEYDIYKFYCSDKTWRINEIMCSPLRKDEHPSFIISNKGGHLHHVDFSVSEFHGDCFSFVKQLFMLNSIDDVLHKIDDDFGLGISPTDKPIGEYLSIIKEYKQPEELGKRYSLIQVETKKFTKEELDYWAQYFITLDDLRKHHIYSIKNLYLNRDRIPSKEEELSFGYFFEGGWWKIYRPMAEKKRKWLSNVPITTVYGLNSLKSAYNTLIVDSLKDFIVCSKIYDHIVQVQNESLCTFSEETVKYITENSKEVFVGFDSDISGKQSSILVTKAFGWKHINIPDKYLPNYKDWSDWVKKEGYEPIKEHFLNKGLIL
jgi:hypothetical protein